ncbi:MAG TPA: hypothetical protein VI199_07795 [Novosphingobium sp.]
MSLFPCRPRHLVDRAGFSSGEARHVAAPRAACNRALDPIVVFMHRMLHFYYIARRVAVGGVTGIPGISQAGTPATDCDRRAAAKKIRADTKMTERSASFQPRDGTAWQQRWPIPARIDNGRAAPRLLSHETRSV